MGRLQRAVVGYWRWSTLAHILLAKATEQRDDRGGHRVLLVLSLVVLRYVDVANLTGWLKQIVRHTTPAAAILLLVAFFVSVLSPDATEPNPLIYLAYTGPVVRVLGLVTLGIGLIRRPGA